MRATLTALVVLVVVLTLPTAAQAQLPVGSADGVKIVRDRGLVVVFTQRATKLWRQVAGREVTLECTELPDPDLTGPQLIGSDEFNVYAPRRGRRLRTGHHTRGNDLCEVSVAPRTVGKGQRRRRIRSRRIVSIPLTQTGAVFLDERKRSLAMLGVVLRAELLRGNRADAAFPAPEQFVARYPRLRRPLPLQVVALSGREGTPPEGAVGYWSNGARSVAVAIVSASGRRLFIEFDEGDDVVRTNVAGFIYSDDLYGDL